MDEKKKQTEFYGDRYNTPEQKKCYHKWSAPVLDTRGEFSTKVVISCERCGDIKVNSI